MSSLRPLPRLHALPPVTGGVYRAHNRGPPRLEDVSGRGETQIADQSPRSTPRRHRILLVGSPGAPGAPSGGQLWRARPGSYGGLQACEEQYIGGFYCLLGLFPTLMHVILFRELTYVTLNSLIVVNCFLERYAGVTV